MESRRAYIGLGANLGDREEMLREAVQRLATLGEVIAVSSLYETEPVGFLDQPPFLNAVAAVVSTQTAGEIVPALLAIERDLGRTRTFRNAPRTLDLDLLLLGDEIVELPGVTLPHPRMHERAFVLFPLAEIAPEEIHPVLRRTIGTLLASLPEDTGVRHYAPPDWQITPAGDADTSQDR
jgi:2-amino-4-hydroxy-6-hydroxymethyldihydropteridine diphosphokinase